MNKGTLFIGQPKTADAKMVLTASNHRFHDYHALFQSYLQGGWKYPKTDKKKGGIKAHANIHANKEVPSDIKYTSATTNDSFMLKPSNYFFKRPPCH